MNTQIIPLQWRSFLIRIILPTALTFALFISATFLFLLPAIQKNSLDRKREMIREFTDLAWNVLARFEAEEQKGALSRSEAQKRAVEQICSLSYGQTKKDYFWINDMHPRMIVHPYRRDLNGRDLTDYVDSRGRPVFKEIVRVVRTSGAGYVKYMWQWKDDESRIVPKISYVKGFAPWGWVVGTGMYIEDVKSEIAAITRDAIMFSGLILCIMALLIATIIFQSFKAEKQRKAAEDALRDSEEKYRTIFETTGTATIIVDNDLIISLANSEFEKLSGYTKQDIEGRRTLADFVAGQDLEMVKGYHYARRQDPASAPRNYEFHFVDRQGRIKDIHMTIALIPGTRRSLGSLLDITDLKDALNVLAESEERFRSLVENALTGIFIVQDDRIVYHNPEHERLFGHLPQGRLKSFEKIHPEDSEKVTRFYQRMKSGELKRLDIDYRFYPLGRDGGEAAVRWAHCRASRIEYMGRPAILVNMMDVTRTRELEHLLGIRDKMVSLGYVAAGIAHEIRNPLSGINIFLDGIGENFQDPESAEDIKDLIRQTQAAAGKIESVVKGVLDFARPNKPRLAPGDINVPVGEAVKLSQAALRKADIQLSTDLQGNLPLISIDVQQMEQVLLNLITNAAESLKDRPGERCIFIQSALEKENVILRVADSGVGVSRADRAKIFDPFYTTKSDGSGIGLSICQRIIVDHRGTIDAVESQYGGAEFVITIPVDEGA